MPFIVSNSDGILNIIGDRLIFFNAKEQLSVVRKSLKREP